MRMGRLPNRRSLHVQPMLRSFSCTGLTTAARRLPGFAKQLPTPHTCLQRSPLRELPGKSMRIMLPSSTALPALTHHHAAAMESRRQLLMCEV